MKKFGIYLLAAALAVAGPARAAEAPEEVPEGSAVLILQVGSDWCVAGDAVQRVFESDAFKALLPDTAIRVLYDEMEEPTPEVAERNKALADIVVRTRRFPALTCYTDRHVYAQLDGLPQDITADALAQRIAVATAGKDAAERLFAEGKYGEGFDILARQMGPFHFDALTKGRVAYEEEWKKLSDAGTAEARGWLAHFTMKEGVKTVTNANAFREQKDFAGGRAYIADLRALPAAHLSLSQRQAIEMAEYALWRTETDEAARQKCRGLLEKVLAMGRDTLWGQAALGYLKMGGADIASRPVTRAAVRPRPLVTRAADWQPPRFPLADVTPREGDARAIARYAVLTAVGAAGWDAVAADAAFPAFWAAFSNDQGWMEDFVWSGPSDYPQAFKALLELWYQDDGRWTAPCGRRFMTALALSYPEKDAAWLADVLDAYRATWADGLLQKAALTQPVWQWRYALHQGHRSVNTDDMAAQQRFLSRFVNVPPKEYGGVCWMLDYNAFNCFGETVQGPLYYKPWEVAGEWCRRRYSYFIGGVCGELSKFGCASANAHGVPSCTCGQPGHCAYTYRRPGGTWEIGYGVTYPSRLHLSFWGGDDLWTYVEALEGTFGGTRAADRYLTLATATGGAAAEAFFRKAVAANPRHYNAWRMYGAWLAQNNRPLADYRAMAFDAARALPSRQPLWDVLTPYLTRVVNEQGASALAAEVAALAPLLRQPEAALAEESDFKLIIAAWTGPFAKDTETCLAVARALLDAQYGTRDYFTQTLAWGAETLMDTAARLDAFIAAIEAAVRTGVKGAGAGAALDFNPLIMSASKAGNLAAFRQLAALRDKLAPCREKGRPYPKTDFGGQLLSDAGLLQTSSTSQWDRPEDYPRALDATPAGEYAFHTDKEKAPWALVTLAGPAEVRGLVLVNRSNGSNGGRQTPIAVQVSEDGRAWRTVFADGEARSVYRVDLRAAAPQAKYVKVLREPEAQDNYFHLRKILVYGKKLY